MRPETQATHPPVPRAPGLAALAASGTSLALGPLLAARLGLGPVDDAYISLRYAANWAGGRGLVFNPGERVEGYTNFLWVLLQSAAIRLGADPETAMALAGTAALAALAGLVAWLAAVHAFPGRPLAAAGAGVLVALHPAQLAWAASGLETPLFAALALAALAAGGGGTRSRHPRVAGILLCLAAMTRPEAVALFPVLCLAIGWKGAARRQLIRFALVFGLGYGTYFALRATHFGYLLPNTFYAKLDYGGTLLLHRGLAYAASFASATPVLTLAALAALLAIRSAPAWVRTLWLAAGVQVAVVVYEGGDHFPLFRFLVPTLPLLALLALQTTTWLAGGAGGSSRRQRFGVAAGLAVLAISCALVPRAPSPSGDGSELEVFAAETERARQWSSFGRYLRDAAPIGASLATIAIGAVGYHSDLAIVDPHGIVDVQIAHVDRELGRGTPGHEKFDVADLLARRPDYILLHNLPSGRPPVAGRPRPVWGAFNAQLIQHRQLVRSYRLETLRVGDGYWSLHVRRDLPAPGPLRTS